MNKSELVDSIAEKSGLTKKDSEKALNAVLESIVDTLSSGEEVVLPNFGTFRVKLRAARKGRNPQTLEEIDIPEKNVVSFSAGKSFKERVENQA